MANRKIKMIIVHCSATPAKMDIGVKTIRKWHVEERGWSDVGYHFVIRRDGTREKGRPVTKAGAHAFGHNKNSIGICLIGGSDEKGKSAGNFTSPQYAELAKLLNRLAAEYNLKDSQIVGHRDLSPDKNKDGKITKDEWMKECPSFSVAQFQADWPNLLRS